MEKEGTALSPSASHETEPKPEEAVDYVYYQHIEFIKFLKSHQFYKNKWIQSYNDFCVIGRP